MLDSRERPQDFPHRPKQPVRLVVAIVTTGHGTAAGTAAALLWLAAAGVFMAAAVHLLAARPVWRRFTPAGVLISTLLDCGACTWHLPGSSLMSCCLPCWRLRGFPLPACTRVQERAGDRPGSAGRPLR
jgi:hypothetical protein